MPEQSTGEAMAQARASINAARLADPEEHFPYKAAEIGALVKKNTKLDPGDGSDVRVEDVMTKRIAEATAAYVAAQEAYLTDPGPGTKSAYDAAGEDLVAARRTHRRARVDADGNPIGGVIGTMTAPAPDHQRGPRLRRVGEE